ncbi:MAG: [FeFe] hydrogenase H-cluster radical SAM maturase HydE [Desulfarculales bacterium]|jgi:biotin synthase|nr:[FeFe] hydrogenase H-cluster radical SAM maturase HydE [Desulfarculales bacterium]
MIDKLYHNRDLSDQEFSDLLAGDAYDRQLFARAAQVRHKVYGKAVYIRGLVELSNYCRNNCYYCGIRHDNRKLSRYRLDREQILACCSDGYALGFRTFVLQGGEDPYYNDDLVCEIASAIKEAHPDCALTLSLGEKSKESYRRFFNAGADRYLLRHETAAEEHYRRLHPPAMSLARRKQCLMDLKEIGYQVGSGFMVGSPHQTGRHLLADLRFLQELQPAMIGIGPYLTHQDTPFKLFGNGSLRLTLRLIGILRLMFPMALIPATTALGTVDPKGRELGLMAGANVLMPNLSPLKVRKLYELYDNKICTGEEAAECRMCLNDRVAGCGYEIVVHRGDAKTAPAADTLPGLVLEAEAATLTA